MSIIWFDPGEVWPKHYHHAPAEEYYYGYGCTIVSTGQKIPIAAEFTEIKQAPEETAKATTTTEPVE